MSQSLARILTHVIFSTKHRYPFINPAVRKELIPYNGGILRNLDSPAVEINCVADHVHILCCLSKNLAMADLVEQVKKASSKWVKGRFQSLRDFYWQAGYGAFSVSQSNVPEVRHYILGQERHHKKRSFQDEFREFLERHQIEYDERYVWD